MPRETFDAELQRLQDETLALASRAESAIMESIEILQRRDLEGARKLIAGDYIINDMRFAIEEEALVLIATQQPLAGDLRTIAAILEIVTELERIADYAKGIAKVTIMVGPDSPVKPPAGLVQMAEGVQSMLRQALDAFVRRDVELARSIPAQDEAIDVLYNQVYHELITGIVGDACTIEPANFLLWAAHNLERAADRTINICERVVFTVTGELMEMDVDEEWCAGIEGLD